MARQSSQITKIHIFFKRCVLHGALTSKPHRNSSVKTEKLYRQGMNLLTLISLLYKIRITNN